MADQCPCGVAINSPWIFHKAIDNHDCLRHSTSGCRTCRDEALLIREVERFLNPSGGA